jgi:LCP family protein required for cell wall assembly
MTDLDLEVLAAWTPEPVEASAEVREHALARLEAAYDGLPTTRRAPSRNRFVKQLAVAMVAVTVLVVGATVWVQREADDRFSKLETVGLPKNALGGGEVGRGPVNILVVGSDQRDGGNPEAFGTPAETGPARSDTMFVLRIDGTDVRGLWLPRDLITSTGVQLNSTFNRGPQALVDTITTDLGITLDHYIEVDFRSFPKIVDEVGGVRIYSPGRMRDAYTGLNLTGPGCRTLDGTTALQWVRSRHLETFDGTEWIDASPRADLDRQARQQEFIRALARRAKVDTAGDPAAAVRLADAVIPALLIDSEFTRAEIVALVRALADVDPASLQLATVPIKVSPDNEGQVVLAQPDADQALAPFRAQTPSTPAPSSGQSVVPPAAPTPEC